MAAQTPVPNVTGPTGPGGIYPTPSGELPAAATFTQVPDGTPNEAYFIVPEGEAGQIVNAMTTALHASDPRKLLSLSGIRSLVDDTIQSVKQTLALVTGTQTAWTVIHATSASQVLFLENSGLTPYSTKSSAQNQASAQSRNVNPAGAGASAPNPLAGLAAIGDFFGKLGQGNTWVRVGEVVVGAILISIGVNALLGGRPLKVVTGAAGAVGKVVP